MAQNLRWKGTFPTNHSSFHKTRCITLSYNVRMWAEVFLFYHNSCVRHTDRQTDGQTNWSWLRSPCIECSGVKMVRFGSPCRVLVTCTVFVFMICVKIVEAGVLGTKRLICLLPKCCEHKRRIKACDDKKTGVILDQAAMCIQITFAGSD